jgi:TRAP-type C4-dicarboxylate transport system substrate-binding protein
MMKQTKILLLLFVIAGTASGQSPVVIKLGTIAPAGSIWHDALLETRQHWREISDGEVELRIYAGGVLGGEAEMVRKMQRRGLDAIAISGSGLPLVDNIVSCLNLPLLFNSYEELEYVRDSVSVELEQSLEAGGYKALSWSEAGWVQFFTKSPVSTPDDLRELRLWTATGAPETERLFKQLGFRVVSLPATDMLTGLQTGLIEAIDVPPLFALLDRSFEVASYMTELKFAPLNAATVITLSAWQRIPSEYQPELLRAVQEVARTMRGEIRRGEQEAIDEMITRGLTVVSPDASAITAWRETAHGAYSELACAGQYPELFEKILLLQREAAGQ